MEMSDRQIRDEVFTILLAGTRQWPSASPGVVLARPSSARRGRLQAEADCQPCWAYTGGRRPARLAYTRMCSRKPCVCTHPSGPYRGPRSPNDEMLATTSRGLIDLCQSVSGAPPPRFLGESKRPSTRGVSRPTAPNEPGGPIFPSGGNLGVVWGCISPMIEMCLVLATVAQRYRLRLVDGAPIEPTSMVSLHPSRDVLAVVERR